MSLINCPLKQKKFLNKYLNHLKTNKKREGFLMMNLKFRIRLGAIQEKGDLIILVTQRVMI